MRGLYGKYTIGKVDGSPVDPQADYFVLRLDTDTNARVAALTYADACEEENPELAVDLRARVKRHVASWNEAMDFAAGSMAREMRDEVDKRTLDALAPAMLEMPDGKLVPQNGPEDRATWWTCTQCGFTGPAVGTNPEGVRRCMGIICGGVKLNPTSPKSPGWREKPE